MLKGNVALATLEHMTSKESFAMFLLFFFGIYTSTLSINFKGW